MWDLIVSVPDHCLSFYLGLFKRRRLSAVKISYQCYMYFNWPGLLPASYNNISNKILYWHICTALFKK